MSRSPLRAALVSAALVASAVASRLGAQTSAAPTLRLPKVFADGMVLQRGAPIPVWGWAAPRTRIVARFRGRTVRAIADASGRWTATLPAARAGGPDTLSVDAGESHVEVRDVLVGDVWVASGQSNMEFRVDQAANAAQAIAAAHDSSIRQFKVPVAWAERPADDVTGGEWAPADPPHVGAFSAVAYFFARELRTSQRVPIGIVNTTWGGSAIETWTSAEAQGMPADGPARALAAERARLDSVGAALRARLDVPARDPGLVNGAAPWARPALDESGWRSIRVPGDWESQGYEGMDGIGWYRTSFTLSADDVARGVRVVLGPIDDDDITWVNGVEVGRTSGYNVPRAYALPARALRAGANVLAVRVADHGGGGGITGSATVPHLEIGGEPRALDGAWKFRVGELSLQLDGQRINKVPAITYNRMVHPLLPMPIRGVIWYQGESNANNAVQAVAYRRQFRTLVESWRGAWNGGRAGSFPFLWVQLPNFGRPDSVPPARPAWALQREAMSAALALPRTGQAITIDVGEANDIHPKNKRDVGHRLGLVGRRVAYREAVLASGPTYRAHRIAGSRVTVTFDHVGRGLVSRAEDGRVGGFAVAGVDRRFVRAQARIERGRVVVWSDEVPAPVAVRYAWANNPADASLANRDGLPAAPFRTDAW